MSEKELYGYTGIFTTPDEIIKAAQTVSNRGYNKFDVNTPYPVHGMDDAMKLPPSKLGYAALVFGISGLIAFFGILYWMLVIDYPIVIGGKPFFAFPAFVPVLFEVLVLSASIATVITMITVYFKFPNVSHPLHDTPYMVHVSRDKYGICIEATDEKFAETEVKALLEELGAVNISPVYFEDSDEGIRILEPKFIGLLIIVAAITSGGTYFALNKLMFMVPFNWMMEQEKVIVQDGASLISEKYEMRQPVRGTVARGEMPYNYSGDPEGAGRNLINPLLPDSNTIDIGKKKYNIYCSPCHGNFGEGDSRLRGKFPNPPSLHSEKSRDWTDGRIYHIITEGQNVMPAYTSQLEPEERWAVVHYIRALQRSFNAKESDLE